MTSPLAPLFEPIVARFDEQAQSIDRLRAEVERLRSAPTPAPPPPEATPDAGWTAIPPPDPSARVVYVSTSAGRPANTGLSPDSHRPRRLAAPQRSRRPSAAKVW